MKIRRISRQDAARWLPHRKPDANKGSAGRIYILAGSRGMIGAALLASLGAVKGGAGLVRLGTSKSQSSFNGRRFPLEVTTDGLPENKSGQIEGKVFSSIDKRVQKFSPDILAIGPGLGVSSSTRALVSKTLSRFTGPVVLDADGLNVLSPLPKQIKRRGELIITPHPGELARLLDESVKKIQSDRVGFARAAARRIHGVCLLKGKNTVVTDGQTVWINPTGNSLMASGGMGDLLTGLIAALWGQMPEASLKFGLQAAALGVFIHGRAGDLAAKKIGGLSVQASQVAEFIPAAINFVRRNS